jgi:hypothetical protein
MTNADEDRETTAQMWRRMLPLALDQRTWDESDLREFVVFVLDAAGSDTRIWELTKGEGTAATFAEFMRERLAALLAQQGPVPQHPRVSDTRAAALTRACEHALREFDTLNREIGGAAMHVDKLKAETLRDAVYAFAHERKPGRPTRGERSRERPLSRGEAALRVWRQLRLAAPVVRGGTPAAEGAEAAAIVAADRFVLRVLPGMGAATRALDALRALNRAKGK